ncbi:MAG: amino acid permease [Bdellovibrionota bacterium]
MSTTHSAEKFGMIRGVFIPSILTIFGVIMYLRLGWMLFHVGILGSIIVITLSSLITFLTSLSIAATATNMRVGAGGAYYMISRSFGIEAGAAIGIPLFLAQALGVAFYITGFAESLTLIFPHLPMTWISVGTLIVLTVVTLISADLTLKLQTFIFTVIAASMVSFYFGHPLSPDEISASTGPIAPVSFWSVFAVIFPAVTGIEAGLSMSGELKDPGKALPYGTIAAVLVGYVIYISIPFCLHFWVPKAILAERFFVMKDVAMIGILIIFGIWGSTLSSAVGALMGAPRTLQALAKDRIVFGFFGTSSGPKQLPIRATIFAALVAMGTLFLGSLNSIATVLTMFFLTSYGFLNIAACIESLMGNPSWRPSFKTHWLVSFVGALACLFTMLMIDSGATIIATIFVLCIYVITKKRQLGQSWSDTRRGILQSVARYSIYHLSQYKPDARTWSPNVLVFSGSPQKRWKLVQLGHSLTRKRDFLTVGSIIDQENVDQSRKFAMEKSIREFLDKNGVSGLAEVHFSKEMSQGARAMVSNYGLGTLKPNVVLIGINKNRDERARYVELLMDIHRMNKNLVIYRDQGDETINYSYPWSDYVGSIDVWWGRRHQNANLMLALSYILFQQSRSKSPLITLKSAILSDDEEESAVQSLDSLIEKGRLKISRKIYKLASDQNYFDVMSHHSEKTELVFIGLRPPEGDESVEHYSEYFGRLLKLTQSLPKVCMVLASEEIQFKEIFQ